MSRGYTFKTVSILKFINWIYLLPLQLPHYNLDLCFFLRYFFNQYFATCAINCNQLVLNLEYSFLLKYLKWIRQYLAHVVNTRYVYMDTFCIYMNAK